MSKVTAELYFQLNEYQAHDCIQLINGKVIIGMPLSPRHQDIIGEIFFVFKTFAKSTGGKAYTAPIELYLDEHNVYRPDVLYMSPDSQCKIRGQRLEGAPELIVDVLSADMSRHDIHEKHAVYARHGVQECWVVDPIANVMDVWVNTEGKFVHQGTYGVDDTLASFAFRADV